MLENTAEYYKTLQDALASVPVGRIIVGLFICLAFIFLRRFLDSVILGRIYKWAKSTSFNYDDQLVDAIRKPFGAFVIVSGFYLGLKVINLHEIAKGLDFNAFFDQSFKVAIAVIIIWFLYRLSDLLSTFISHRLSGTDDLMRKQFLPLVTRSIRVFIVSVGILLIVQNLGYSIGSLLAGLGIGGLAVALAAQDTLANFFSSIMLLTDMPFRVDDWVKFGDVEGTIESIGFRTTRVRTFEKSLITVPNKIFMNTPIENFTMRDRRRIKLSLAITYDSTPEQIEAYVAGCRKIVSDHQEICQDFHLVYFTDYGDCSLNVLVYCFTTTIVWKEYLRIREELLMAFYKLASEVGVSYAFPSRTLYWGPEQKPLPTP